MHPLELARNPFMRVIGKAVHHTLSFQRLSTTKSPEMSDKESCWPWGSADYHTGGSQMLWKLPELQVYDTGDSVLAAGVFQ
jgi:hypothetical protein